MDTLGRFIGAIILVAFLVGLIAIAGWQVVASAFLLAMLLWFAIWLVAR